MISSPNVEFNSSTHHAKVDDPARLDPELLAHGDQRNVVDKYRHWHLDAIRQDLAESASELEIAIENLERDFNMGTIIRSANAFNVRRVHIIGRKQWNKRGAMMTDKYLEVVHHPSVTDFLSAAPADYQLIALDNQSGAHDLATFPLPRQAILIFGSENSGISAELLQHVHAMVQIEQFGSTRSINVGVAAGIAMYEWTRRFKLTPQIDK